MRRQRGGAPGVAAGAERTSSHGRKAWRRALGLLVGVTSAVLGIVTSPARAGAQTDPRLVAAVKTAQEGASDSARTVVRRLLDATAPTDSLYPEILYTQAMVAGDAGEMRRHLQRVVVEYGGSSWADDALLRLVQMDYASRTLDAAARNLEKLRSDYPDTPLLSQAAYWAARTYFDLKNTNLACRWLADGMARAPDVEAQNQLGYLFQRCGTAEAAAGMADSSAQPGRDSVAAPGAPADTGRVRDSVPRPLDSVPPRPATPARPRTPTRAAPSPAAPARTQFRVQVSAVATPGAADDAASKVEGLGYPAVIVRERGLYKVRAGSFQTREQAQAAVAKLKAAMGGNPFIVAEP